MWMDEMKLYFPVMTKQQQKAAEYLMKESAQIKEMSLQELAGIVKVGQPTIIRMLEKCGYMSWSRFKQEIWKDSGNITDIYFGQKVGEKRYQGKYSSVLKSIEEDIQMISEMLIQLDLQQLDYVVKRMKHAKIIDVYGTDNSANAAAELAGRLLHLGFASRNYPDLFFQKISAEHLGKKDMAFGFSVSGETQAVIDALKAAKESGALTIAVTGDRDSTMAFHADHIFITPTCYNNEASKWIASRITQIAFVDVICNAVMQTDEPKYQMELKRSSEGFQQDMSIRVKNYNIEKIKNDDTEKVKN